MKPASASGGLERRRRRQRGNHTLEFTMIGLPLTFLLFSIANMCFSMLTLHTLQESVEQTGRYVSTRGSTCSAGSNSCSVTVQQIAGALARNAPGISPTNINLTLTPDSGTSPISCAPLSSCLSTCAGDCSASRSTVWPPSTDNAPGKDIVLSASVSLRAPMFMFWSGASASTRITNVGFGAYTRQRLMF